MKQVCAGNTTILADELNNTRIRVNSFNPGPVATKIRLQAFPAEDRDALTKNGKSLIDVRDKFRSL